LKRGINNAAGLLDGFEQIVSMVFIVLVKKAESEGGSGCGFLCHVVDNACVHGPVWLEVSSLRAPLEEKTRSGWCQQPPFHFL
jgi:hypothetical protein